MRENKWILDKKMKLSGPVCYSKGQESYCVKSLSFRTSILFPQIKRRDFIKREIEAESRKYKLKMWKKTEGFLKKEKFRGLLTAFMGAIKMWKRIN